MSCATRKKKNQIEQDNFFIEDFGDHEFSFASHKKIIKQPKGQQGGEIMVDF
jgi:hypothetical protein